MKKRSILFYLCLLAAVSVVSLACQPSGAIDNSTKAPSFELFDLNGETFSSDSLKGKVVLLNFWRTNCPPCRLEVPDFQELYEKYKDQGFEIVGVSLDREGPAVVEPFARSFGVTYTMVFPDRQILEDYGPIRYIPTTFIIDRKGNISEQFVGYRDKATFEKAIKNLL